MATYLRMSLRVPMQSDNSFSMVRVSVRGRASLLFKNKRLGLTAIQVLNDQVRTACFKNGCEADAISERTILRWRFAVCELAYITLNVSYRYVACWRLSYRAGDGGNVRC